MFRSAKNNQTLGGGKPTRRKSVKHGYVTNVLTQPTEANVKGNLGRTKRAASRGGVVDASVSTQSSSKLHVGAGPAGSTTNLQQSLNDMNRRSLARTIAISVACLLAVLAIGVVVSVVVFMNGLDSKMALPESEGTAVAANSLTTADVLVSAEEGKPYYTLVAADLDQAGLSSLGDGPDAIALVRIDPSTKAVTVLEIPADTQVSLQDGNTHQLRSAPGQDGTAAFIQDVANMTGVSINHYVQVNAEALVTLVDNFGGIKVNLAEEVDDPAAGDTYVAAGQQTLNGQQALTVARASNYKGGRSTRAANNAAILAAVGKQLAGVGTVDFLTTLDKLNGGVAADVSAWGAHNLAQVMSDFDESAVQAAVLPGSESGGSSSSSSGASSSGTSGTSQAAASSGAAYTLSTSEVRTMIERVDAGEAPVEPQVKVSVDPKSFTITVRNGGGVTGAAASVTEELTAKNYQVQDTGNTDTQAYEETLVIYDDTKYADAAQALVDELGTGRTVQSNGTYTYSTNVLVIIGKDITLN